MSFVKVAALPDHADPVFEVVGEGRPIALCRIDNEWRAIGGVCPHRGGPLGHGALEGEHLLCPWHAWAFHTATGANDFDPTCRVATYDVKVENGEIWIDLA
ncbi:MAG TPA: hypothetical protein DEQ47_06375 [Solibacterales bacterium]|nr:hypothetical protein [Bryobacterales bacterium]